MRKMVIRLMRIVQDNNLDELIYLIEHGVDIINTQDKYGKTILVHAIEKRRLSISKYLIDNGADVNIQDKYGNTALMLAVIRNCIEIVKNLIQHGADINLQDEDGCDVLIWAASYNHLDIVQYLIESQRYSVEMYLTHPNNQVRSVIKKIIKSLKDKNND